MKKEYLIRAVLIVWILLSIAILFFLWLPKRTWTVFSMNETIGEDHADVVFVGSSHASSGINPIQLFEEEGIAGYDVATGSQSPWQSYYYVKQSYKYQHPKLVVFDVYMVGSVQNESYYKDYQTVSGLLDCPLSVDKIEAVLASEADSKLSILLRYPYIYDEYSSQERFTWKKYYGVQIPLMGYNFQTNMYPCEDVADVSCIDESSDLLPKNEKYLRLIIEYCQGVGIELLLINAPWPCVTGDTQRYFNRIGEIAKEYGVPFINGCSYASEIGMNYAVDCADEGGHLNHFGVTKFTGYVGDFISKNYALPDRREDPEYEIYWVGVEELKVLGEKSTEKDIYER